LSQKSKFDYDYVYNYIKENDCELLSETYKNMKEHLLLRCNCGEIFKITFNDFKFSGVHHCKKCTNKLKSKARSLKYDYVKEEIESKGCRLLSSTVSDAHEKLIIECKCGDIFIRSFNKFKTGQNKCLKCSNKTQWNYEEVLNYVQENSKCELLSDNYINENTNMDFLCECGNIFTTTFSSFIHNNKRHCNICGNDIRKEKIKVGIDILRERVLNISKCELLSEDYDDYNTVLNFRCECGEIFNTSYMCFIHGNRSCNKCNPNSKMETISENMLKNNNIEYISQHTFKELRGVNGGILRFDFKIIFNDNSYILLELDGEQHEKPMGFRNGNEKFIITQEHDKRKNEYCENNNIKLYRISYKNIDYLEEILNNILHKHGNPVPSS
jgi:hypothetical protein